MRCSLTVAITCVYAAQINADDVEDDDETKIYQQRDVDDTFLLASPSMRVLCRCTARHLTLETGVRSSFEPTQLAAGAARLSYTPAADAAAAISRLTTAASH